MRPTVISPHSPPPVAGPPPHGIAVRAVVPGDASAWLRMRRALWPKGREAEHRWEIAQFFAGLAREPLAVFLAADAAGSAVGFAELSLRGRAAGCRTGRVGYLEGWYVAPHARRRGVGRALVAAADRWARSQGCLELASDTAAGQRRGCRGTSRRGV